MHVLVSKSVRRVRTPAGARKYGQPIGSIIVLDIIPSAHVDMVHSVDLMAAGKGLDRPHRNLSDSQLSAKLNALAKKSKTSKFTDRDADLEDELLDEWEAREAEAKAKKKASTAKKAAAKKVAESETPRGKDSGSGGKYSKHTNAQINKLLDKHEATQKTRELYARESDDFDDLLDEMEWRTADPDSRSPLTVREYGVELHDANMLLDSKKVSLVLKTIKEEQDRWVALQRPGLAFGMGDGADMETATGSYYVKEDELLLHANHLNFGFGFGPGWSVIGREHQAMEDLIRGVIYHEMGHAMTRGLPYDERRELHASISKLLQEKYPHIGTIELPIGVGYRAKHTLNEAALEKEIGSRYAAYNVEELMAEAWADYRLNQKKARKLSLEIARMIEKYANMQFRHEDIIAKVIEVLKRMAEDGCLLGTRGGLIVGRLPEDDEVTVEKAVRRVRTPSGAKRFGQPIGSIIVRDPITGKLKALAPDRVVPDFMSGEGRRSAPGEVHGGMPKNTVGRAEAQAAKVGDAPVTTRRTGRRPYRSVPPRDMQAGDVVISDNGKRLGVVKEASTFMGKTTITFDTGKKKDFPADKKMRVKFDREKPAPDSKHERPTTWFRAVKGLSDAEIEKELDYIADIDKERGGTENQSKLKSDELAREDELYDELDRRGGPQAPRAETPPAKKAAAKKAPAKKVAAKKAPAKKTGKIVVAKPPKKAAPKPAAKKTVPAKKTSHAKKATGSKRAPAKPKKPVDPTAPTRSGQAMDVHGLNDPKKLQGVEGIGTRKGTVTGKPGTRRLLSVKGGSESDTYLRQRYGIPPAYTDIRWNLSRDERVKDDDAYDGLIYQARAENGKIQSVYTSRHRDIKDRVKFGESGEDAGDVAAVINNREALMKKFLADIASKDAKRKAAASAVLVQLLTGLRVGSDADTKKGVHGASTLYAKHVTFSGDKVTISFFAKGRRKAENPDGTPKLDKNGKVIWLPGKQYSVTSTDKTLIKLLKDAKVGKKPEDRLFEKSNVNGYLKVVMEELDIKDANITSHNFRHAFATATAMKLASRKKPRSEEEFQTMQAEIVTAVAELINDTRKVAFGSYIDPSVWDDLRGRHNWTDWKVKG